MLRQHGPLGTRIRRTGILALSALLFAAAPFASFQDDTARSSEVAAADVIEPVADAGAPEVVEFASLTSLYAEDTQPSLPLPSQTPATPPPAPTPTTAPTVPAVAPAPASSVHIDPTSRGGSRSPNPDISSRDKFIAVVAEAAQDSQRLTGVPASVTVAQAILESEWGKSLLATRAFNFFGIKARNGPGPAGVINMNTWEVLSGANTTVTATFKAYHNVYESVEDHGHFLRDNSRYAAAFKAASDPREFARRINQAGYATDPAYAAKLIGLMDRYNLYQHDLPTP